jgi:membrane-associated protease RseP (regulator of RpoE activity)
MRTTFPGSVVVIGLLLTTIIGAPQFAIAQRSHEPTVDERYRDANSKAAETELPRLNAPLSNVERENVSAARSSTAAYLGVTFSGDERAAIIRSIAPRSPAEQAGLQPNDLIETLQGKRIRTSQDVLDIVAKMRPGDVLDISFTRRMNIRTQAPLASAPSATPREVGYPPDSPTGIMSAPEDPTTQTRRNSNWWNQTDSSNDRRRSDKQKDNESDQNRRLLDRLLRRR